jgi:hypothetical protein
MNEEEHVSTHLWAIVPVFLINLPFESTSSDGLARALFLPAKHHVGSTEIPASSCIYILIKELLPSPRNLLGQRHLISRTLKLLM